MLLLELFNDVSSPLSSAKVKFDLFADLYAFIGLLRLFGIYTRH